jgi:hypothetical protein
MERKENMKTTQLDPLAVETWQMRNRVYAARPYGGPALTVHNGAVGDGLRLLARFDSTAAAERIMRKAGFRKISYGWKATHI